MDCKNREVILSSVPNLLPMHCIGVAVILSTSFWQGCIPLNTSEQFSPISYVGVNLLGRSNIHLIFIHTYNLKVDYILSLMITAMNRISLFVEFDFLELMPKIDRDFRINTTTFPEILTKRLIPFFERILHS